MLASCPRCLTKSRVSSSHAISNETRELYCQCLNLNCGLTFVCFLSVARIIEQTGKKPDPLIQPELIRNHGQLDLMDEYFSEI